MTPMPRSHTVTAHGLDLHVVTWGDDAAPPVLLLHGSNGHARLWDGVAERLAPSFRVLALDLRGHGDSQRPSPPAYRFADYAADVVAVVQALNLPPVALVGHSMGALVSMLLAGEALLPLRALALLDIEANPPPHQAQHLNAAGVRPARRFASWDDLFALEARSFPSVPPTRLAAMVRHAARQCDDGQIEHKADRTALAQFEQVDYRPYLPRISSPTLVLRGANSAVMRREVAETMAAALPAGHFVEVTDAGHQLHVEQPRAVAEALLHVLT